MIDVKEAEAHYLSTFTQLEKKLAATGPSWVHAIRRAALDCFAQLGFPTSREEDWKYTSVTPLTDVVFRPAEPELAASRAVKSQRQALEEVAAGRAAIASWHAAQEIGRLPLANLKCSRLTFINGHYCPELSTPETLPQGVKVGSFSAALKGHVASLEGHLARYADYKTHPLVALNTAFLEDGVFVELPKGVVLERPIHLLYLAQPDGQPMVWHPRNLILAGRESQAAFIETYLGLAEGVYFTNAVTELVAGEGAVIDYCKVQQESEAAVHYARVQIHQHRSSTVATHSLAFGGALVREEVQTVLDGEGAEALLHGLYIVAGQQHVDNHSTIDHAKPHCNSRELYKGVLEGKSGGVFNGKIIVRKDAQKTDSKQSNKNLLLSEEAVINTKPQLEIYADDVKCTHGATVGQIDPEAVFYLRSRGIALPEARHLLTFAFANDILEQIKHAPLREQLSGSLFARLAKAQPVEEA
jgi:Fe-S cluster assembly protein SufD